MGGPRQQWQADLVDLSNLKTDNDGMTFILTVIDVFSGLVHSFKEQIRDIVADGAEKHIHRRLAKDVADRSRTRISESVRSGSVEEVWHPPLLHSQRGDESERSRKIH